MTHNQKSVTFFIVSMSILLILLFFGVISVFPQTNMGPVRTPQINTTLYVGQSGYATIQSAVTFACKTGSQSFIVTILPGVAPSDSPTSVIGGCSGTYLADLRQLPHRYYAWSGTAYLMTSIVPQLSFTSGGALNLAAGSLMANSPLCTEASGCPAQPTSYPPAGIGVSTGTSWSPNSIPPASLATWPAAGIPVSLGTAWGNSIPPNQLPAPGSNGQVLVNANGVINATSNLNLPGSLTASLGQRLTDGSNLNSITTCGDFDTLNPVNGPPQIPSGSRVAFHNWCSGDPVYMVQFAWNMAQFGQPTQIYARNNRAGTWTAWTNMLMDDGAGNVNLTGNATIAGNVSANNVNWTNAVNVPGTPDFNNIPGTGLFYINDGCSANCPTSNHAVDARQGFLIQIAVNSGTPSGQGWQLFTSVNDTQNMGGIFYTRLWRPQVGAWSSWATFMNSFQSLSATTLPGTISDHPLTAAGQPSRVVPNTPRTSQQRCRKNAMWHDAGYIYVCVRDGEVKRAALSSF